MRNVVDHSQGICKGRPSCRGAFRKSTTQLLAKGGRPVEAHLEWQVRCGHGGAFQTRAPLAHVEGMHSIFAFPWAELGVMIHFLDPRDELGGTFWYPLSCFVCTSLCFCLVWG